MRAPPNAPSTRATGTAQSKTLDTSKLPSLGDTFNKNKSAQLQ